MGLSLTMDMSMRGGLGKAGTPAVPFVPLVSTSWRQPLLGGFDSAGTITTSLANSSTGKTLPLGQVAVSGQSAITVTSGAVTNGSATVTVAAVAHGRTTNDYVKVAGTTTTPAANANGLFQITVVDANTFTYTAPANFTVTNASIGGTYNWNSGTARDFSVKFDTVPAAGSFLYLHIQSSSGWSVAPFQSSDSVDGSAGSGAWTGGTLLSPFQTPSTISGTGPQNGAIQRGQVIPFTTTGWKRVHIINYDEINTCDVCIGAFKQPNALSLGDLGVTVGSSIVIQDDNPLVLRQRVQLVDNTRDPIFVNSGYPGAKVTDMQTILTTWAGYGVTPSYITLSPGPNNTSPNRPYSTDPSQALVTTQMQSILSYMKTTWGNSIPVFTANMGHFNPTTAPAVNDLTNTENGCEPYDFNQCEPTIKNNFPSYNWNNTWGRPVLDELIAFAQLPPGTVSIPGFFLDGTTHPKSWNYDFTQQWIDIIANYCTTGSMGLAYIERVIASLESNGAPSWYKTRLQTIYGLITNGSFANLTTRLNAVSTTYSEPAGSPPTDRPGNLVAWYDPAKFDTITLSTTNGLVSQINDRSANAYHLPQATDAKKPIYIPNRIKGLGYLSATNGSKLGGTAAPAGLYGSLDAASQNFMITTVVRSFGVGSSGSILGLGQSTANKLQLAVSGLDALGLAGSGANLKIIGATTGVPNGTTLVTSSGNLSTYKVKVLSIVYDGTNVALRINGVQDSIAAWAKPAWTGDAFSWLCNGPDLSRAAANAGDLVIRNAYSLSDVGADETYLVNKWGAT